MNPHTEQITWHPLSSGQLGRIVGSNDSANFDVAFDPDTKFKGLILNCHPNDLEIVKAAA